MSTDIIHAENANLKGSGLEGSAGTTMKSRKPVDEYREILEEEEKKEHSIHDIKR